MLNHATKNATDPATNLAKNLANNKIDLNADLGEGAENDAAILALVSSANIACGGHTGDGNSMRTAIRLAKQNGVTIGAHPSFIDRENFGRSTMHPPLDALYFDLKKQIQTLIQIANEEGTTVKYVKAHGALYNQTAHDIALAEVLMQATIDSNSKLGLMCLAGSPIVQWAQQKNIKVIEEAFADRRYNADGTLVSRNLNNACIDDKEEAIQQCVALVKMHQLKAVTNELITSTAQSICVHGDGEHALALVRQIHSRFAQEKIRICPAF
jgi:UPF0271 protein